MPMRLMLFDAQGEKFIKELRRRRPYIYTSKRRSAADLELLFKTLGGWTASRLDDIINLYFAGNFIHANPTQINMNFRR